MNIREFFNAAFGPTATEQPRHTTNPRTDTHRVSSEITIYRRERSAIWQCRFKLRDGRWHRLSTGCIDPEQARLTAIRLAEQWTIREDLGLPVKRPCFSAVANAVIDDLRSAASSSQGKVVYRDYIMVIERYLNPYFGRMTFEEITPEIVRDFDGWRNARLKKVPRASTLRTHASAFNRVIDLAKRRGLLPLNRTPPALTIQGEPSQPRPSFSEREIKHLLAFLPDWAARGRLAIEQEIRPLLRDYVEFLLYTGVRHGTEARRLEWCHLQWHWEGERKYLRVWVSGKTGPRYLITRPGAITALDRLARRNRDKTLDVLIEEQTNGLVFVSKSGYEPHGFEGSFRRLMRDSGLLKDSSGKNRTLYSLRHTYAHFALLKDSMDHYALATQMGTSVKMIEQHYGHITPAHIAAKLAGPRMGLS